ncbi:MAG: hypothetical protein OEZ02_10110 [Anaerolineae bacterium]|nr:hypothetical protein [Anaerolineae bacterium]
MLFLFVLTQLVGPSSQSPGNAIEQIRAFTRDSEFDYVAWTLDALGVKFGQFSLAAADYMDAAAQKQAVLDYIDMVGEIHKAEGALESVFADPGIEDIEAAAAPLREQLATLYKQRTWLGPLAESVLQNQVAAMAAEMGFALGGQSVPPVLYHSTPLPWALIVSPRGVIQQDANISLQTEMNVEQHVVLEKKISAALDVSTLVVPVGGIGTYPTMVAQTTNLVWLTEVIAHEWMHNYLTMRPLGMKYSATPEMRTMNETTASIAGTEIGQAVIAAYYPEFLPPPPPPQDDNAPEPPPPDPNAFNFRAEMHKTRVHVDELLAEGKIEAAEAYMEARRVFFWEHGYHIRKLNQAYFAFYGAYADVAGGAAGEDPVGEAVRNLRQMSATLFEFVRQIAWMSSFEELQILVAKNR